MLLHAQFTLLPPVVSLHCGNASPPPSRVTIAQPHPTIIAPQASTSRTTTYLNDNDNHLGRADGGPSELPSLIVFYHNAQGGHVAVGDVANNNRWRMTNDRQQARTTANDNANQNRPRSFMQTTMETNHNELRCYVSVRDLATANANANQNRPQPLMQMTTETDHNEPRCYISVGDLAIPHHTAHKHEQQPMTTPTKTDHDHLCKRQRKQITTS
ncbi:uncharacterized protein LACBIDRAFT_327841 [Laccaria bicolor S238N-H82]|uniref:Predicted protein n=1 Tax=Laccaria bicolor (strain S238N-H82 / ATCC MYA-4686) TaxID=486041 RepID=B0DD00_LACBS|nr:uncharacterized protein LACBIDRAFT_327841 [Laccaria bicolor S238N-H82]EDR07386.1 predicted protein [Laccaria bicolor S238N-H82]|eukprot:XP_001881778.1 predicted protein [Laccaria bicolor S238N-H82]